ncbi:hypothetical protein [Vibrio phage phiKT1028]|nr:hypothetical protein [Vibrio phage phiKT1028]
MKKFFNFLVWWCKEKLAGKELKELETLKLRLNDLETWCSYDPSVSAGARWVKDPNSYPSQCHGPHGSIEDFRRYLSEHFHPSAPVKSAWRE